MLDDYSEGDRSQCEQNTHLPSTSSQDQSHPKKQPNKQIKTGTPHFLKPIIHFETLVLNSAPVIRNAPLEKADSSKPKITAPQTLTEPYVIISH